MRTRKTLDSVLNLSRCSQAKGDVTLEAHLEMMMPFWLSSLGVVVVLLVEMLPNILQYTSYLAITRNQKCQCCRTLRKDRTCLNNAGKNRAGKTEKPSHLVTYGHAVYKG